MRLMPGLLIAVLVPTSFALSAEPPLPPPAAARAVAEYESECARIDEDATWRKERAKAEALRKLEAAQKAAVQSGNLEMALAVRELQAKVAGPAAGAAPATRPAAGSASAAGANGDQQGAGAKGATGGNVTAEELQRIRDAFAKHKAGEAADYVAGMTSALDRVYAGDPASWTVKEVESRVAATGAIYAATVGSEGYIDRHPAWAYLKHVETWISAAANERELAARLSWYANMLAHRRVDGITPAKLGRRPLHLFFAANAEDYSTPKAKKALLAKVYPIYKAFGAGEELEDYGRNLDAQ